MGSRRKAGKPLFAGNGSSVSKGKSISPQYRDSSGDPGAGSNNDEVDQLSHSMSNTILDDPTQGGGDWEVFVKKPKNRGGGPKQWGSPSPTPNAWGHPNVAQKLGIGGNGGTGKPTGLAWQTSAADTRKSTGRGTNSAQPYDSSLKNNYIAPRAVAPPLQHGWQWDARSGSSPVTLGQGSGGEDFGSNTGGEQHQTDDDEDNDDDLIDDDDYIDDDFDSDGSVKSFETRKKHRWLKSFFDTLDQLTVEELNDPVRQWHCPACKNGPGAIDWYRGLQPLMAHAKTKGATRVKLHRELAELLEEELFRRGTSVIPAGETYGQWAGLREKESDREIIWPPMIVVMNTQLEMDENDQKWLGMGNQELLDYFSSYKKAVKARHSYGPKGHRGMSIIIFESSVVGYHDAERLHKHFTVQGTDRYAWDNHRVLFYPGGKRQLYGYMARKEDLDNFNRHCQGKTKLKFEVGSYIEMVVEPMRKMSEDNEQLTWLKSKVVKEQRHSKTLEESFGVLSQKLRKTEEENRIVRERTKKQHEQNKEEMDYQEQFFKNQISVIHQALEDNERAFEERLQEERDMVKRSTAESTTLEDDKLRRFEEFTKSQAQGVQEFLADRDNLIKNHEDKKAEMKRRHMAEELDLERDFESTLTKLMEKYAPHSSEEISPTISQGDS